MFMPRITLENLTFSFAQADKPLFDSLNLSLVNKHYGLVGNNGSGKSTLLKLILGELQPDSGHIEITGNIATLPQDSQAFENQSVAEVLGIAEKLAALKRINNGSIAQQDYETVGDDWLLETEITEYFTQLGLATLPLEQGFVNLSGGERTRLLIVKCLLSNADFLILDEPTNNLDKEAREIFYQLIRNWPKGLLVASHDRELLRVMNHIVELTPIDVYHYGGNYDDYVMQREIAMAARHHQAHSRLKNLETAKTQVQKRLIQHRKGEAKGRRAKKAEIAAKGTYDKLGFKAQQGRSERTASRIKNQANRQLNQLQEKIDEAKAQIPIEESLSFDLAKTKVATNKIIIEVSNLIFAYQQQTPLFNKFNFTLQGPNRVALQGKNGAGKSTLIKLILNQLTPQQGEIKLGTQQVAYLDQFCSMLIAENSVLENFQQMNPEQTITESYQHLAQFKFRNKQALVKVHQLSNGEKLRALLACTLMATQPPQLLILDEPTNHLDLTSIEYLESVLSKYQGALLVISHDETFLKNIGITRRVCL